MSGGGGLIIISGKNAAGVQGGGGNVPQSTAQAAIDVLTANGSSTLTPIINALTSALTFSQS